MARPQTHDDLADAYDDELGRLRCTATSRRSGARCRNRPRLGATVCRMHGGSAPQVRRTAELRLASMVDPALDSLAKILGAERSIGYDDKGRPFVIGPADADLIRAAEAVLDRAGYPRRTGVDLEDSTDRLLARLRELADDPDAA